MGSFGYRSCLQNVCNILILNATGMKKVNNEVVGVSTIWRVQSFIIPLRIRQIKDSSVDLLPEQASVAVTFVQEYIRQPSSTQPRVLSIAKEH